MDELKAASPGRSGAVSHAGHRTRHRTGEYGSGRIVDEDGNLIERGR